MPDTVTETATPLDLDAIEARHFAARDGEWKTTATENDTPVVYVDHESIRDAVTVLFEADWGEPADAEFIAHAHQDVPALVAEVKRLRTVVDILGRNLQGGAQAVKDLLAGATAQREEQDRHLEEARGLLETALALLTHGEDPRANRTVRRLQYEARALLAALDKPGEETHG